MVSSSAPCLHLVKPVCFQQFCFLQGVLSLQPVPNMTSMSTTERTQVAISLEGTPGRGEGVRSTFLWKTRQKGGVGVMVCDLGFTSGQTTHNTQRTVNTHNTQLTTHKTHNTTHNTTHTTQNTQHNTHNTTQHTTHKTHNTQHTTHNTQHTTHNTQHNTQHTKHTATQHNT